MVKLNTVLLVGSFLLLLYLVLNPTYSSNGLVRDPVKAGTPNLVDRTGSDWNQSGHLAPEVGLRQTADGPIWVPPKEGETPFAGDVVFKGTVTPWTSEVSSPATQKTTIYTDVNTPVGFYGPEGVEQEGGNPNMPPAHLGRAGKGKVSKGSSAHRDSYGQYKLQDELYPNYYNKTEVFTSDYYPWWRNQHYWPYYTRSHNWMYRYPYYSYWRRPHYYNYWASPYYPSRTILVKPYLKEMKNKTNLRRQISDSFRTSKIND